MDRPGELPFGDAREARRTTLIEWTESTWNPMVGCSLESPGCTNCYAMKAAHRIQSRGTAPHYDGLTRVVNGKAVWTGKVGRASDAAMRKPLSTTAPTVFFVNSMSDFFHPDMEDGWRDEAFDIMRQTPRHTYQILTKRPAVMAAYLERRPHFADLRNVWLGASVEREQETHRIATLRGIPAAVRFLSVEPLIASLGPVDLTGIDWIITGGESGPGARPVEAAWVREVRDAAKRYGAAFFHKQWGLWEFNPMFREVGMTVGAARFHDLDPGSKGGATLDGRLWREMPRR